ncbi:MAG: hypothetical protein ACOYKR_08325 [Sphingobacterium thalpophilum]
MNEKEQAAFVEAYANNVSGIDEKIVADFVARYESGEDIDYSWEYTSIMDALCMWHSAIRFNLEALKND